jgi:hypothetical protein
MQSALTQDATLGDEQGMAEVQDFLESMMDGRDIAETKRKYINIESYLESLSESVNDKDKWKKFAEDVKSTLTGILRLEDLDNKHALSNDGAEFEKEHKKILADWLSQTTKQRRKDYLTNCIESEKPIIRVEMLEDLLEELSEFALEPRSKRPRRAAPEGLNPNSDESME